MSPTSGSAAAITATTTTVAGRALRLSVVTRTST
jgi:hypothetical protein